MTKPNATADHRALLAERDELVKSCESAWGEANRWRERALRAEGAAETMRDLLKLVVAK